MTDVQVNPGGRLQHSDAQQTGKGNKVKPIRSFGAYVIARASIEAKSLVSFFPREKQINASRWREEAPLIDLSSRFADEMRRLRDATALAESARR
ncbi:unnamed protein product [Lasius platythorax]|uniref:Uncharacterized protein n=1 Tax=Lasius platythorax TaxID=488582 RepID=A0AAV2NIY7_9HYME